MVDHATPFLIKSWHKKVLIAIVVLIIVSSVGIWYIFNEKFTDIAQRKIDYSVNADDMIHEFQKNENVANKKYAEKIMTVRGIVSEVETADSVVNIKFIENETGGYIIFAFQEQNIKEAINLKEGDSVTIKGSCSGGAYSTILESQFITFKRCALNK